MREKSFPSVKKVRKRKKNGFTHYFYFHVEKKTLSFPLSPEEKFVEVSGWDGMGRGIKNVQQFYHNEIRLKLLPTVHWHEYLRKVERETDGLRQRLDNTNAIQFYVFYRLWFIPGWNSC